MMASDCYRNPQPPIPMNSTQPKPVNKCVRVHAGDVFLLGDLQIPAESHALIIFAYGGGRSRNNPRNLHIARVIREKGLATLLCDLMTEDEEIEDESTEKYRHDAAFLAKRLKAVTQWALGETDTKGLPIGYFGGGAGGAAALIAAADPHSKVWAAVSRGGRMDLARKSLPRVKCPTLLILGEQDTVGIELNREALPHLKCRKELQVVPGASHLFGEPGKLEILSRLSAEWFSRHLADGGGGV